MTTIQETLKQWWEANKDKHGVAILPMKITCKDGRLYHQGNLSAEPTQTEDYSGAGLTMRVTVSEDACPTTP